MLESIAEAYVTPTAWPRAIVGGDAVVGFVMANWGPDNELEQFRAGIWRLNVDESAQGTGVGRFAVGVRPSGQTATAVSCRSVPPLSEAAQTQRRRRCGPGL